VKGLEAKVRRIRISGHRHLRTVTCPYCKHVAKVTLVTHLKRAHPDRWVEWTREFVRLYNKTNDLKRVMRHFRSSDGELVLSWTVIDREIKRSVEHADVKARFLPKQGGFRSSPQTDEYERFRTTVWDIPRRGTWGVHQSNYRGNWPPQVVRAVLEEYSSPGELVLDAFVGGGTTLLEAHALGRNAIGFDISDYAVQLTRTRLTELCGRAARESILGLPPVRVSVRKGDARRLPGIKPDSVDLICTHPPYCDALQYSSGHPADLSFIKDPGRFLSELMVVGARFLEVLKPGKRCALLIGDLKRDGNLHTLGVDALVGFRGLGFIVEEIIIKTQNRDRSTEFYYRDDALRFRLNHEYLLVLRKPGHEQNGIGGGHE